MAGKIDYIVRSLSKGTTKKYETYVVNAIWQKLNNTNIEFVTQQYVKTESARRYIDMYFPQIKFAIEVDEGYHDNELQTIKDNKRMDNIKTAFLDSILFDKEKDIEFLRVKIVENGKQSSIEKLDADIDKAVSIIKAKYEKIGSPKWIYDQEEKIKEIISRGYIKRGDCIDKMIPIMKIFGQNLTCCRKCYYKVNGGFVWSPTLSVNGSDRNGWVNTISEDLSTIYEKGKSKSKANADYDIKNGTKRFTFLKFKDSLGNKNRRFLGVYKATGFDQNNQTEIWTIVDDIAPIR